jgi:hypothetical protein
MIDDTQRALAETVFEREQRLDTEINDALTMEATRRAVAVQNMQRLRALRLARETKANND